MAVSIWNSGSCKFIHSSHIDGQSIHPGKYRFHLLFEGTPLAHPICSTTGSDMVSQSLLEGFLDIQRLCNSAVSDVDGPRMPESGTEF